MNRGGCRRGAGRKPGWRHGRTQTIRVPVALAEQLLEMARKLDLSEDRSEDRGTEKVDNPWSKLQAVLSEWQGKCEGEPADSPEWEKVRQLLSEIEQALSPPDETSPETETPDSDEGRRPERRRHHHRRGRHFGSPHQAQLVWERWERYYIGFQ